MMRGHLPGAALAAAVLILNLCGLAHAASGEDIALKGNAQGATPCSDCHGGHGEGQPDAGFPRLAGLNAGYIAHQLASFADGTRPNDIMGPIAKTLSAAEQQAVASYFAGLNPPLAAATTPAAPDPVAAGAVLAQRGDWSKGLPGCGQCHGPGGTGVGSRFPRLTGQSAAYIASQLLSWKKGARHDDPIGLMKSVATKLDDNEIKAVAAYYASLPLAGSTAPVTAPVASTTSPAATKPATGAATFTPPPESAIPNNKFGDMVRLGETIFTDTQHSAKGFVGNNLQCANCHIDRGRLANASPLWAAYVVYPAYRAKNGQVNTFEERMQGCFRFSMNGKAPPAGDKVLVALQTYAFFLAKGAPTGVNLPGRGYPKLKKPAKLDYAHGQEVYAAHCAVCHGTEAQGQSSARGDVVFPPLWGAKSFNWGAGMGSITNAAEFVKANMPLGEGGSLSDQDAWDVATYIDSQERPQDPRFAGSLAETRKKYHNSAMSMYGRVANGVLLGEKSPPSGILPQAH
ncbi:MAG TPA: c-type cytochrome [Methylovirgula sp.]